MLWRQKDLGSNLRPAASHLYEGGQSLPIPDAVSSPWGLCEKSVCEASAEFLEPHRRPSTWPYALLCSVLQVRKNLVLHILYQVEHHLAGKQTPTQWVIIQCSTEQICAVLQYITCKAINMEETEQKLSNLSAI